MSETFIEGKDIVINNNDLLFLNFNVINEF